MNNDRRRQVSRKERHSSSGAGTSSPPSRGARERGRRKAGGGGGGENERATNDARSSGVAHPQQFPSTSISSTAEEPRRRRRPPDPPSQRSYPQPPKAESINNHGNKQQSNSNSNTSSSFGTTGGKQRRPKKEIHSSVLAAIDALDTFKTYKPPNLSSHRMKYKRLQSSSSAASVGDHFADVSVNATVGSSSSRGVSFHRGTKTSATNAPTAASTPTYKSSTDFAGSVTSFGDRSNVSANNNRVVAVNNNPNSRQRQRGHGSGSGTPRSRGTQHRSSRSSNKAHREFPPHHRELGSSASIRKSDNGNSVEITINDPPPSRDREQSSTNKQTTLSSTITTTTTTTTTRKSQSSSSSKSSKTSKQLSPRSKTRAELLTTTPRLQNDLQTRRRRALDVTCVYADDGHVELDVPGLLVSVDPYAVYEEKFSPYVRSGGSSKGGVGRSNNGHGGDDDDDDENDYSKREEGPGSRLGKNGWHRALDTIDCPPPTGSNKLARTSSKSRSSHSTAATLDQLTVTHLLQNVHPQSDEFNAIQEEYRHLLAEVKALEKDRVQLEARFHEAGRITSRRKDSNNNKEDRMTYQSFRTNLRYMKCEDMRSLPVTWLEDVPLSSSPENNNNGDDDDKQPSKKTTTYAKLDEPFQRSIRHHRGTGLALLIADPQCKSSLIGRCYSANGNNSNHTRKIAPHSSMLKREKAATLIDEGGEWLRHCAITGFDGTASGDSSPKNANETDAHGGTTYFLKFDGGDAHRRGDLPSNLVARLFREGKRESSVGYLSTGCSYSAGGGRRCYYAEFDDGECWWGTNKDDVLDGIFNEVDVHRVAFGSGGGAAEESSWVVVGKDGTVRWRNVPQGLHDALIAQDSGSFADDDHDPTTSRAAPCEVSLGIGGTYFVRFLDGRVDYSLPNFVADAFDKFEADGKLVRGVALHVDTYDCLIRYSSDGGNAQDV